MKKLILTLFGLSPIIVAMIFLQKALSGMGIVLGMITLFGYLIFVFSKAIYTYVVYGNVDFYIKLPFWTLMRTLPLGCGWGSGMSKSIWSNNRLRLIAAEENQSYEKMVRRRNLSIPVMFATLIASPFITLFIMFIGTMIFENIRL